MSIITGTQNQQIQRAASLLKNGGVVAIPTETVYGLAAAINHNAAISRIFSLKNRPTQHPLIVHLADAAQLPHYAVDIPDYVEALITHFWPGPLTLVLKKSTAIDPSITGGQDSVALRIPNHPIARALLHELGTPVAAPSANRYCAISPTRAEHVLNGFDGQVPVLDGGPCQIGIESTIIDARDPTRLCLLRHGDITQTDLKRVLSDFKLDWSNPTKPLKPINYPGQMAKHYAPKKPLFLVEKNSLALLLSQYPADQIYWLDLPQEPKAYAAMLYDALQQADQSPQACIALELPPNTSDYLAIHDRLSKAGKRLLPTTKN